MKKTFLVVAFFFITSPVFASLNWEFTFTNNPSASEEDAVNQLLGTDYQYLKKYEVTQYFSGISWNYDANPDWTLGAILIKDGTSGNLEPEVPLDLGGSQLYTLFTPQNQTDSATLVDDFLFFYDSEKIGRAHV